MSLRAILSGSRVKKRTAPAAAGPNKKAKTTSTSTASPSSSPWANSRQTKPNSNGSGSTKAQQSKEAVEVEKDGEGEQSEDFDYFDDDDYQLDDSGLVASLADDLSLRDVVQALRYSRSNMFDPIPSAGGHNGDGAEDDPSGLTRGGPRAASRWGFVGNSTRVTELLNMRRRMPALATTAHIAALLPNATATERETVALVRAGVLRKVVQPQWRRGAAAASGRQGGGSSDGGSPSKGSSGGGDGRFRRALAIGGESLGEVLVERVELQKLVRQGPSSQALSEDTKAAFTSWLGGDDAIHHPSTAVSAPIAVQRVFTINNQPAPQLTVKMVDELVRAGFLVGHGATSGLLGSISITGHHSASTGGDGGSSGGRERGSQSDTGDVYARPEDRTTLLSLETVAKAASGSFDAVGGVGAVYTAGGGGARSGVGKSSSTRRAAGGGPVAIPTEDLLLAIPGHGTFVKLVSGALAYLTGILARTSYRETLETSLRERWDAGGSIAKSNAGSMSGARHQGFRRVPLSRTRKWKDFYGLSFDWVLAEALGAGLVELFDTGSVGRGVRLLS